MIKTKKGPGQPKKEPSTVIAVPIDKIHVVEKIIGRKFATEQVPIVKVRVLTVDVEKIRKALRQ